MRDVMCVLCALCSVLCALCAVLYALCAVLVALCFVLAAVLCAVWLCVSCVMRMINVRLTERKISPPKKKHF